MKDCRSCKHKGNNAEDRCRGCWKDGVWRKWVAAEEVSPWIPVDEKFPPKCSLIPWYTEDVLVCLMNGDIDIAYYSEYTDIWYGDFGTYDHVIAWMPLPEPYKPKEETP